LAICTVDISPVAVGALAVNVHVWGLGGRVIIGLADTLADPGWEARATREQRSADELHAMRLQTAFLLADKLFPSSAVRTK
jgi:hypothetical protein